jgi:predicted ArsR family transcriptional regulator
VSAPMPIDAVPLGQTRRAVLVAVTQQRRPTVRSVADYAGVNIQTAYTHLERLRDLGLVSWEPNHSGTLRSLVELVPVCDAS